MLDKNTKIYVAGHRGLVGSAIWNNLQQRGYNCLVGRTHKELDLLDPVAVRAFFDNERPEAVVLAAAHVGGIMANLNYRADFIYQNLQIQQNVIGESFRHGVKKLLFLGSTCIYPRMAPQPMAEDALLTSELEYTNEPYAIAKIAGLKMCESFSLQFKSAIAFGKAEIVTDEAEKIHGLRLICERFLPQHMDAFDQSIARSLSRTAVVRITLTEPPTGKRKQYDKEGVEMKYGRME